MKFLTSQNFPKLGVSISTREEILGHIYRHSENENILDAT